MKGKAPGRLQALVRHLEGYLFVLNEPPLRQTSCPASDRPPAPPAAPCSPAELSRVFRTNTKEFQLDWGRNR